MWIDTYCAIKTANLNAVFVCHINEPGEHPELKLYFNGGPLAAKSTNIQPYNADQLPDALVRWRQLAESA
jgi:hypothetical protein